MNKLNRAAAWLLALALLLSAACLPALAQAAQPKVLTDVVTDKDQVTVEVGKSTTLKIQFYQDEDGWENPTIYVPNKTIAKVSRQDNQYDVTYTITGAAPGESRFRILYGPGNTLERIIPVTVVAKTLDVSRQSIQVEEGETATLTLTFADAAAKEAAVVETPDQAVAKAERKDGEKDITYTVTGVAAGSTQFRVKYGPNNALEAVVTVTVTAKKPVTVPELGKDEVIVKEGKKTTLTIKFPKDAEARKAAQIQLPDESLVKVTRKNYTYKIELTFTGKAMGQGEVRILYGPNNSLEMVVPVTVTPKKPLPAETLVLSHSEITLEKGKSLKLTATTGPQYANTKVTWKSDAKKIATVGSKGKVTAKKVGTATITATTPSGIKATCVVTVVPKGYTPTPSPAPEETPAPETTPVPEATPAPEATPEPEATPMPSASPVATLVAYTPDEIPVP